MYVKTINLFCAGNKVIVKYQAQRAGLTPTPCKKHTADPALIASRFPHALLWVTFYEQRVAIVECRSLEIH